MDVKLGGRYKYSYGMPWDIEKVRLDEAHDGLSCRILRRFTPREMPKNFIDTLCCADVNHLVYVIFDDGYITVVSTESELFPLPTE